MQRVMGSAVVVLALLAVLMVGRSSVSAGPVPNPDPDIRAKRYVVSVPAAAVNLTGWVPSVVPLGQAILSPQPYIIG